LKSKRIVVYGGAFNPPHIGHKEVVEYLLTVRGIDQVIVAPCGIHRIKGEFTVPFHHRLEMTRILFKDMPEVIVSDIDQVPGETTEGSGSTLALLEKVKDLYGCKDLKHKIYSVIGQDNADNIACWYKSEVLIEKWPFIVLPRGIHSPSDGAWYLQEPHIYASDFRRVSASSTEIRRNLMSTLLPEPIFRYILQFNLYDLYKK